MKRKIIGRVMLLIIFVAGCAPVSQRGPEVSDVSWPDYRKPLVQDMPVFQYGRHKIQSATISVDLPEDFLKDREEIILVFDLESRTEGGFEVFSPYVRINRSAFKTSGIPVKNLPYRQVAEAKIKCEHLNAGPNTLQASFRWKGNYSGCTEVGCGYVVHKVSFKDASP